MTYHTNQSPETIHHSCWDLWVDIKDLYDLATNPNTPPSELVAAIIALQNHSEANQDIVRKYIKSVRATP